MLRSLLHATTHVGGPRLAASLSSSLPASSVAVTTLSRRLLSGQRAKSTCAFANHNNSRRQVLQSVRHRRPVRRGEPVAFHIRDLVNQSNGHSSTFEQRPPPKKRQYESDLVVVLDMDECLIHSQFLSPSAQMYAHQLKKKHDAASNSQEMVDHFHVVLPDGDQVHVNMRPYLHEFLEQVSEKYETHIFTAAMQVYAEPVLDRLDPEGTRFAGRWYRDSCTYSAGAYVKNLAHLPFLPDASLDRVVLVDNNPLSFLSNPENGILVKSFYNDATDSSLPAVLELLEELEATDDVRPVLDARFGLQEALRDLVNATQHHV